MTCLGAQESLAAHSGTYDLTLKKRKGFVEVALTRGASLVPVFAFGENDLFDQVPNPEGSWVRHVQQWMTRTAGFTLPLFHGRGIFMYDFGILPYRKEVNTVVGKPIECPLIENPTKEQIDEYHTKYMDAVQELYESYKNRFALKRSQSLRFVN